jgi:hypothetical protein
MALAAGQIIADVGDFSRIKNRGIFVPRKRMTFTKRLREGIRRGEITCSVRFWTSPHVRVGARYRMEEGWIEVESIDTIGFPDITPELARESGFLGVLDLLKVAKHGSGENIYLIRFHYVRARSKPARGRKVA